jgi:hypothetical protein
MQRSLFGLFGAARALEGALRGCVLLLAFGLPLHALATTYTFASPNYSFVIPFTPPCTIGTCADYTTSMNVAGSFTTAAPLAANLVNADVRPQVTSFSFNDGINTYSSSDPNVRLLALELSTDASGVPIPTQTFIDVQQWTTGSAPHVAGNRLNEIFVDFNADDFNNAGCLSVGTKSGVADACLTRSTTDTNQSEGTNSVAGTWTVTPGGGPAATTTTLASSANPASSGQSVTFTATVAGNSPTGSVQFRDGATNLGGPVALAGGVATLTTSSLSAGSHSISAVYGGDPNNAASTSSILVEVVNGLPVPTSAQAIPTLSEAMLVLLAGLLAAATAFAQRRKRG